MSSQSVWVQLYYEEQEQATPEGRATSVKKPKDVEESEWNADALIEAAQAKLKLDAPLHKICVYSPGTTPPFSEDRAIDPGDPVPTDTTSKNPLIVVAPPPPQQKDALIAAAEEKVRKEGEEKGRKETREEIKELQKKLDAGSFFTPIDEVWKKVTAAPDEFRGGFGNLRRESKYYETVADYDAIVKNAKRPADGGNHVEEALASIAIQGDRGKATSGIGKTKRSRRRSGRGAVKSAPPLEGVDEHSQSDFSESTAGSVGSQASSHSAFDNPDFNGNTPSSRAHLAPESDCRYPFAISCQAVCGVDLERNEIKRFADGMVNSDTNFLRTPSNHGKMFDATPCWIFVPIVTKE